MSKQSATVRVRLVLEVESHGAWGEDCSIAQAKRQGLSDAMGNLRRVLGEAHGITIVECVGTDIVIKERP